MNIFKDIFVLYNEMAFYLLFGFIIAGFLHVLFPKEKIMHSLGKPDFGSVLKSAIIGVPLPLCSCGVVPTAVSLYKQGASRGAVMSFLTSTPQTGVDSILATYGLLGPIFAVFRPIAAFVNGILAGIFTNIISKKDEVARTSGFSDYCCAVCGRENDGHRHGFFAVIKKALSYSFGDFLDDIANWIILGIIIAGLIDLFIPREFFLKYTGSNLESMLLMVLVGIPLYVCSTGSIPIAVVMMMKGLSAGAALVFLVCGPATNAASLILITKTIGKKFALIFVLSIAVTSILMGFLLNYVFELFSVNPIEHISAARHVHNASNWFYYVKIASSVILGVLLIKSIFVKYGFIKKPESKILTAKGDTFEISIEGMVCSHCRDTVEKAIKNTAGVKEVIVYLNKKIAIVKGEKLDIKQLEKNIKDAGYKPVKFNKINSE